MEILADSLLKGGLTLNQMTPAEREGVYPELHRQSQGVFCLPNGDQLVAGYEDAAGVMSCSVKDVAGNRLPDRITVERSLDPACGYGAIMRNPRALGHFLFRLVPPPAPATANLADKAAHSLIWNTMTGKDGHFARHSHDGRHARELHEARLPKMQAHASEALRGSSDGITTNVTDFSVLYAARVIADAVGLPSKHYGQVAELAGAQSSLLGQPFLRGKPLAQGVKALGVLSKLSDRLVQDPPVGSFAARLRSTEGISKRQAVSAVMNTIAAGVFTVAGTVQNELAAMGDDSTPHVQWTGWSDLINPGAVERAAANALEFRPGLSSWRRDVTDQAVLPSGAKLAEGKVFPILPAANRDPARDGKRSLTFGQGVHRCPGDQLAYTALAAALRGIHDRYGEGPVHISVGDPRNRPYDILFTGADVWLSKA